MRARAAAPRLEIAIRRPLRERGPVGEVSLTRFLAQRDGAPTVGGGNGETPDCVAERLPVPKRYWPQEVR